MIRPLLSAFVASFSIVLLAAPYTPNIELSLSPAEIYVTRSTVAKISFLLPFRLRNNPQISADFIPKDAQLRLQSKPIKINGTNFLQYVTLVTIPAGEPGRHTLGPVTVGLPDGRKRSPFASFFDDDFFGVQQQYVYFTSKTATLVVKEPPQAGRPASDIGAIANDLQAIAQINTNVCTAGDPLLFSITIKAAADFSRVRPPLLPKSEVFQGDEASLKTESGDGYKRFSWRVRTRKAATTEFPACEIGWFDSDKACWRTIKTAPIPIQVRAGMQVALGNTIEDSTDVFPMPDGLELDFPQDHFTLRHALSLAKRATTAKEFRKAAELYQNYLSQTYGDESFDLKLLNPFASTLQLQAKHYRNLAALQILGEESAKALQTCKRAEWLDGATPGSTRNLRAALAKLHDNPRADLPILRQFFPAFYTLTFSERILAGFFGVILLALILFWLGKRGRRTTTFLLTLAFTYLAQAQFSVPFFDRKLSSNVIPKPQPIGSLRLEPAHVTVGQPAAFIFSFKTDKGETIDQLRFGGLPHSGVEYGEIETLPNNEFRVPARFIEPFSNQVEAVAIGMITQTKRGVRFSSSYSSNFIDRFKPITICVEPLPEQNRPNDFSGSLGEGFVLEQKYEPAAIHPGDLVTITYQLRFSGYCPSNALPKIERIATDFKAYPLKETSRTRNSVTWTQMIVPQSATATNMMAASLTYYDVTARRYREVKAKPIALAFVSEHAASTRNTAIVVNGTVPTNDREQRSLILHFAPHENSPIVATLPIDTPITESYKTTDGWKRITTDHAAGWIR